MGRRKTRMISQESKDRIKESLSSLGGDNLTVEQMETISGLREFIDSEDESEGALKEWEDKYRAMEQDYRNAMDENSRVVEAYRKRWNDSYTGTLVNGQFVDKTVEDVSGYSYDNLMKGE